MNLLFTRPVQGVLALFLIFFCAQSVFAQDEVNLPPLAYAGPDVQADEGTFTQLDGSGSYDPEFGPLIYSWTQISGPTAVTANADTAILDINVPIVGGTGGVMTFMLTVTDDVGQISTDTADVVIKKVNLAPVASIVAPASVMEGAPVTLNGSGSYDPNFDFITSYTWAQLAGPAVTLNLTDPVRPTFTAPTTGTGALLRFSLTVSDGSLSGTTIAEILVTVANQAPLANAGANQTVGFGDTVTLDGSASSDSDLDALTYAWTQTAGPAVSLNLTNPAKPTFTTPNMATTLTFSLVVNDGKINSAAASVSVFVFSNDAIPNCAQARINKKQLWPPNHTMSRIKIRGLKGKNHLEVLNDDDGGDDTDEGDSDSDDSDEDAGLLTVHVTSITQDEPTLGTGNGDVGPDAIVQTSRPDGRERLRDMIMVRRERADSGNGRVYQINFTATNAASGLSCNGKVQVCVPTKKGKKGQCVNSGQNFNSQQ